MNSLLLLDGNAGLVLDGQHRRAGVGLLTTKEQAAEAFVTAPTSVWLAQRAASMQLLNGWSRYPAPSHRLLVPFKVSAARLPFLLGLFQDVIIHPSLLPKEELLEALAAPNRRDLIVGGVTDHQAQALVLYRGDLSALLVPLAWFTPRPAAPVPDPRRLSFADFGHTIRLGGYEAATDAILYEFDAAYRRRERRRRLEEDTSFGGALRRLRLQKGLSREDFAPLSAKEIARLERGEVRTPHAQTVARLAESLGVAPEDIATY